MTAVFLSYRRDEAGGYSGRIYDRLRLILGRENVFMDVQSIRPGSDWRRVLEERIVSAGAVVVLIGPAWIALTDAQGRRRLDDPEDVTRWEIATAIGLGKRIIPVLLQGAAPLQSADLPEPLAPLARLQCMEIRHGAFDAGMEALIAELTGESLRDVAELARRRLRMHRAMVAGIPAIAGAAALFSCLWLFDIVTLDTRAATWTLALADGLAPIPLDESIVLVGIDRRHAPADPAMRGRYAAALTQLGAARARAAILDIHFHADRPGDEVLAQAMRSARAAGVAVYFTFVELAGGQPRAPAQFADAATRLGLACVGSKLGITVTSALAFGIRKAADGMTVNPLPSLPLLGALFAVRVDAVDAADGSLRVGVEGGRSAEVDFSLLHREAGGRQGCGAIQPGTRTAELLVRTSPRDRLLARRLDFDDVIGARFAPDRIAGKTVVIGYETDDETFTIARGLRREHRYGYQLHADSINTLAQRRVPRFVHWAVEALSAAALAALGALLAVRQRSSTGWRLWLALFAMLAAYLALAVAFAAAEDILLNSTYDIFAFVVAYALYRTLARRWLA